MPTLLIRQINPSKSATELLDASDRRRYFVACGKQLVDFYCAKCVYVGEQYDAELAETGLYIHLGHNAPSAKAAYPFEKTTQHLQNQLLTYRAFYLDRFDRQTCQVLENNGLFLQLDMIAYRLSRVIFEDRELKDRVFELLKTHNEQMRVDRSSGIEAMVLQAILILAHGDELHPYVREITAATNQISNEQGESIKVSPEKVGHALKRLGLHTSRDTKGRSLVLDKATQIRVHELSLEYGVLPVIPQCGYCHNLQTPPSEEVM